MHTEERLFDEIEPQQFDLAELHWLLLQRFKGAMQPSANEVVYPGDRGNYCIKLRLGSAGKATDILIGPKLTEIERDALREQIIAELLTSSGVRVGSVVLFSDLPVDGWYRHGTTLQILPPPKEAPLAKSLLADHPFVLQFSFPSSSNWVVRNSRKAARGRELGLLLTGLLAGSVRSITSGGEHHWTILSEPTGGLRSEYLQTGYVCSNFFDESDWFALTEDLAPLPEAEPGIYYFRWGISGESRFEVPTNLSDLVEGFEKLSTRERDQFMRACYWLELAGKFYLISRSAAFAALVTSVEALMGSESGGPACKGCGRPTGKSITRQFIDLLDEMAPWGAQVERARKELYSVRSALLHGSRLLPSDHLGIAPGPDLGEEFENMSHAQCLVRLVLANWLGKKAGIVAADVRS